MKLWLLRPREDLPDDRDLNPWVPWYDRCFAVVVRAETEADARAFANENAGGENRYKPADPAQRSYVREVGPWLTADLSTCIELTGDGEAGVIVQDIFEA